MEKEIYRDANTKYGSNYMPKKKKVKWKKRYLGIQNSQFQLVMRTEQATDIRGGEMRTFVSQARARLRQVSSKRLMNAAQLSKRSS